MRWLFAIAFVACGGGSSTSSGGSGGNVQGLLVQPTGAQSLSISAPGGTLQLGAYQRDSDPYGGGTLVLVNASWSSSMTSVATVNQSGLVTAVAAGSSTITASSGGTTGTATVTVASGMSAAGAGDGSPAR
jgi:Bacterial Ig-like domain (group 2)